MQINRLPPQELEIEESILASCFFGDTDEISISLLPEHFYKTAHQKIYAAILELLNKDIVPGPSETATALREANRLEEIGGATYLARLIDQVPISHNIKHHVQIIRDKYALRKMIEISHNTARKCFEDSENIESIIDQTKKQINEIDTGAGGTFVSYYDLVESEIDRYEELQNNRGKISGITTGFSLVDNIMCGLQDTDLIVIAARPSMGKTAIALNIAGHVAEYEKKPVGIFSLEMSNSQLFTRHTASKSNINSQRFRTGHFSQNDWLKITDAVGELSEAPIFLDDSASLHYTEIRRRAWEIKKKEGIKLFIVDHLQLVHGDKGSTRDREIGSITAGLKALAKELKLPVLLLSQLSRALETRNDKRPRLSDLRDSGNIEQDADVIAFLYRDEVYNEDENNPHRGTAELNFAKQRNGPTGMVRLYWNSKTTTFKNLSHEPGL